MVLGENSQISRRRLQIFAYRSGAFCVNAVACRTTRLVFHLSYVDILSRRACTKSDNRVGNYQPFESSRFHNAVSLRLYLS